MFIETSLLFKTIIVLSSQLAIVLAGCFFSLRMAREAYEKNSTFMGLSFKGSVNMKRKLDLIPYLKQKDTFPKKMAKVIDKDTTEFVSAKDQDEVIAFMKDGYRHSPEEDGRIFALFITWCITLFLTAAFVTLNSGINTWILLSIFSATSILFGPLLGLIMLEMDENDGFTALKIVLVVTILTGFIGYSDFYSFSEDPLFGAMLMFSLFGLLIFNFVRFFMEFSRNTTRIAAIFGSILFSLFLIYDFNYIKIQADFYAINDWNTAVEMAFILYLDIINLLLEILDAMGNS